MRKDENLIFCTKNLSKLVNSIISQKIVTSGIGSKNASNYAKDVNCFYCDELFICEQSRSWNIRHGNTFNVDIREIASFLCCVLLFYLKEHCCCMYIFRIRLIKMVHKISLIIRSGHAGECYSATCVEYR